MAAPSIHSTQPWRFGLAPESRSVEVVSTGGGSCRWPTRICPPQQPSVGAAVFNPRVAAVHLGWDPIVRLLPAAHDRDLLATVQLAGPAPRRAAALVRPA
ncbi:hypothetical protein [Streptomyces sp. 2A115]|uniref:hypothetical protein n=1 Tax=Streptomyces sp. 2A115 TaxID=3457439 RepID=UPI003FCF90AD